MCVSLCLSLSRYSPSSLSLYLPLSLSVSLSFPLSPSQSLDPSTYLYIYLSFPCIYPFIYEILILISMVVQSFFLSKLLFLSSFSILHFHKIHPFASLCFIFLPLCLLHSRLPSLSLKMSFCLYVVHSFSIPERPYFFLFFPTLFPLIRSLFLSVCLSVCFSLNLSFSLFLSLSLSLSLSLFRPISLSSLCSSLYPSTYFYIYLSFLFLYLVIFKLKKKKTFLLDMSMAVY